jgi:protein-S-isoprenylcysteine O-methyltransferase Ste14
MRKLENLIPPPAVLLLTLVAMFFISRFDQTLVLKADNFSLNTLLATTLVISGIAIAILGIKQFRKSDTTVNPLRPDTASILVTSGVFTLTRNPMYLGMLLISLSSVAFYGSVWCLTAVAAFMAFITRFQIIPEETAMASLFGKEYDAYKASTRRWI